MRRYVVTFWKKCEDVWPEILRQLMIGEAAFSVIERRGDNAIVVECPEKTALFLRDRNEVQSLLVDGKPQKAAL